MGNMFKLNCEGLVCPMPVAKTKRKLLDMDSGDFLEITGDFAEAGENIKRLGFLSSGSKLVIATAIGTG